MPRSTVPNLNPHGWLIQYAPNALGGYDQVDLPYSEFISKDADTQEFTQTWDASGNQATYTIDVYFSDWETGAVTQAVLGTSRFNGITSQLDRSPPVEHPYKRQYFATSLSAKPYSFASKFVGPARTGGTKGIPHAGYVYCRVQIVFKKFRAVIQSDSLFDSLNSRVNIGGTLYRKEYLRYVVDSWETATEAIVREAGQWAWGEGAGSGGPGTATGPAVGGTFKAPVPDTVGKQTRVLKWLRVPRRGLFSNGGGGPPTNLLSCVGAVNANSFLGHAPGTLRMEPPRFEPLDAPDYGSVTLSSPDDPAACFDVSIPLTVWDPPPGGFTRGHNLAPSSTGDGYWFLINSKVGGRLIYPAVDFSQAFVLNP
jgi:hypothetical protein